MVDVQFNLNGNRMASPILELRDFIESNPGNPNLVPPLIHVTDGGNLYSILSSKKLLSDKCSVVDTPSTVFMFVGKPAYKLSSKPESEFWDAPVVFVFDKALYASVDRLSPFDTGASSSGRYDNILGGRVDGEWDIPANPQAVASIVKTFFGSRENYYSSIAKTPSRMKEEYNIAPNGIKILALAALYNSSKTTSMDDRKSTMEAQTSKDIALQSYLRGIILPEEWLADELGIRAPLEDMGCIIAPYEVYPIDRSQYTSELYRLCKVITEEMTRHENRSI